MYRQLPQKVATKIGYTVHKADTNRSQMNHRDRNDALNKEKNLKNEMKTKKGNPEFVYNCINNCKQNGSFSREKER